MEHLLGPKALVKYGPEIDEIPWLGFDHEGTRPIVVLNGQQGRGISNFMAYPLHRGWKEREIGQMTTSAFQDQKTLAMIQSWFFFGLWEAALLQPLATKDYVFDRGDGQVIKTHALREHVRPFIEPVPSGSRKVTAEYSLRVQLTLSQASQLYNQISIAHDNLKTEGDDTKPPSASATLVAAVLRMALLSLEYISRSVGFVIPGPKPIKVNLFYTKANMQQLAQRFQKNNWCPSAWRYLVRISYSTLEYASLIYRRGSQTLHQKCLLDRCSARNVDDHSSIPCHVKDDCICAYWRPPLPKLFQILKEGKIPLLSTKAILNPDKDQSFQIRPYEDGMPFTSFSHVWADGLGSTSEKGLPWCQVERLCRKVTTEYFWLDALCIPKNEELRKNAIRSMAVIYSKAETVLVLDANLMLEPADEIDAEELCVKILTSDWNQRLWTLQEVMLSTSAHFEFKDTRMSLKKIIGRSHTEFGNQFTPLFGCVQALSIMWMASTHGAMFDTIRDNRAAKDGSVPLGVIVNLLANRSSSKLTDEPFVIAPLVSVDVSTLLDVNGDERMERLLLALKHISSRSVFTQTEKLTKPGFRWAPRSFIKCGPWHEHFSRQDKWPGVVTEKGLRGQQLLIKLVNGFEPQMEVMSYTILNQAKNQFYKLITRKSSKKHRVTALAVSADSVESLQPNGVCDALCLEQEEVVSDGVSVYVPHGVFSILPYNSKPEESGIKKDAILALAPEMEEIVIS